MRSLLPPSYVQQHGHAERVELARDRVPRLRNKVSYRLAHWPIWIWVFFIAPGPVTFDLFAHGPTPTMGLWLLAVLAGTGLAAIRGRLPGVEPAPYILRFNEDRPNPLYRRVCYTLAWSEAVAYAVLNSAGLIDAIVHGAWRMRAIYDAWYLPIAGTIWVLGALGWLPRVGRSTRGEGYERRYFYGSVWAVSVAQPVLWLLWKVVPAGRPGDVFKLIVFWGVLAWMGNRARRGLLPRTRPILPGEVVVAD
ncbi:MAG: hypothetical protein R2752_09940 [Vicinamibacterales bacterium]